MFIDNQIENELTAVCDAASLFKFLSKRIRYILPIKDKIVAKIASLYDIDINTNIFDLLFFNKNSIGEYEYDILTAYVNAVSFASAASESLSPQYSCLYILLLSSQRVCAFDEYMLSDLDRSKIWMNYQSIFLSEIFDMYIPSYASTETVKELLDGHYGLHKIITDKPQDNYIYNSPNIKQLRAIILDIYGQHDVIKKSTFADLFKLETKTRVFLDRVHDTGARFAKYFSNSNQYQYEGSELDLTLDEVYSIFLIFGNPQLPKESLIDAIAELKKKFILNGGTDLKIVDQFLRELLSISYDLIDTYHYNQYLAIIDEYVYKDTNHDIDTATESVSNSDYFNSFEAAMEAYKKNSVAIHKTENKIYKAYKNYKDNEDKVDSQLSKAVQFGKKLLIGDVKTEIIEGKKFSAISLLKTALGTAALFSVNWIAALISIVVKYSLKKSVTVSEKRKICLELEAEIEMINEKIDDARSDGDREAKYSMMRTRTELENALKKIKYGLEADERSVNSAKNVISSIRRQILMLNLSQFLPALEADDITNEVEDNAAKALGKSPTSNNSDNMKTDNIFGDDGEDDNDIDAANPESDDDSENLEDNNDVNGDDDNLEDDDLDNDTDSENDDLPDDSPTESADEIEKRKTLINNMIALYNILSGSIDLLESYTSSTELSSDESTTLFNILANLTESKNILYKEITNGFTNKTYVELVKTYVGINNVYDLCTEILNKHFDNLELQLQKTHPARSKRSRKK